MNEAKVVDEVHVVRILNHLASSNQMAYDPLNKQSGDRVLGGLLALRLFLGLRNPGLV